MAGLQHEYKKDLERPKKSEFIENVFLAFMLGVFPTAVDVVEWR